MIIESWNIMSDNVGDDGKSALQLIELSLTRSCQLLKEWSAEERIRCPHRIKDNPLRAAEPQRLFSPIMPA